MKSNYTKNDTNYVQPLKLAAVTLLALTWTGACVSSSAYKQLEDQYKQSEARTAELETANKTLNERIAELTEELEAKDAEIKSLSEAQEDSASPAEMSRLLQEKAALERQLAGLKTGQRSMNTTFEGLNGALKTQLEEGDIKIKQVEGVVRVIVEDGVFFDSGSTSINSSGREVLDRIATALKDNPDAALIIEGYTDSRRIGPKLRKKYATNWDLGAARAINVVRYLNTKGIGTDRLSAQTFGDGQSSADNTTAEGRAANRRIQISVVQIQNMDASAESETTTESEIKEMIKEEMDGAKEDAEKAEAEMKEDAASEMEKVNEAMEPVESVSEEGDAESAEQPAENAQ